MKISVWEEEQFDLDLLVIEHPDGKSTVTGTFEDLRDGSTREIDMELNHIRAFPPVTEANIIIGIVADQVKGIKF